MLAAEIEPQGVPAGYLPQMVLQRRVITKKAAKQNLIHPASEVRTQHVQPPFQRVMVWAGGFPKAL